MFNAIKPDWQLLIYREDRIFSLCFHALNDKERTAWPCSPSVEIGQEKNNCRR